MQQKLSDFLAKVLCTPSMRPGNHGICRIVHRQDAFEFANLEGLFSCLGRHWLYPVEATILDTVGGIDALARTHGEHRSAGTLWRGEQGRERRQLLRDMIQYLRERGE